MTTIDTTIITDMIPVLLTLAVFSAIVGAMNKLRV